MRFFHSLRAGFLCLFLAASTLPACAFLQKHETSVVQAADVIEKTAGIMKILDAAGVEYIEGLPETPSPDQLVLAADISRGVVQAHRHLTEAKKAIEALDVKSAREELRESLRALSHVCDALEKAGHDCTQVRESLEDLFAVVS